MTVSPTLYLSLGKVVATDSCNRSGALHLTFDAKKKFMNQIRFFLSQIMGQQGAINNYNQL